MDTGKKKYNSKQENILTDSANENLAEKPKVAVEWHSCEEHKKRFNKVNITTV